MDQSLVALVSRFQPLRKNGNECIGPCCFCGSAAEDSLKVGDVAWRTICCCAQEENGSDSIGWLMSWSGCTREEAAAKLGNGGLPESIPVQISALRTLPFWGAPWLDKLPGARVWIHERPEGVHGGREFYPERVHLGIVTDPVWGNLSQVKERECILLPINLEASFERMDALATRLYAAGHSKVKYIDVHDQEDMWSWPGQLGKEQARAFAVAHAKSYPNSEAASNSRLVMNEGYSFNNSQEIKSRSVLAGMGEFPSDSPIPSRNLNPDHLPIKEGDNIEGGAGANRPIDVIPTSEQIGTHDQLVHGPDIAGRHIGMPGVLSSEPFMPGILATSGRTEFGVGVGTVVDAITEDARSPHNTPIVGQADPKGKLRVVEGNTLRVPKLENASDPDQLPAFSEFALARAFADGPGVDWRYTAAWGLWAKWDGIRWVQDERKLITWEAKNCCAAVMQDHLADSTPAQRLKVATFRTTNSVIGLAMADPRIATGAEQWDSDPWLLGTPAGIVDLRTGQTVTADKAQFISKSTLIAPAAGPHPLFDMVIARPGTGAGMLPFLWRWLGYILSGDVREERFLFLHGLGNSGKGTLIKVIADILGDYAKVVAIQAFTESQHQRHSQEIAKLQGARFVYASETEEGSRFDEAMLKWLTGRDKITAHKMRQDDIEFYPQFKLLIYGNNRPSLKSVGEDMRRRIDLIEFPGTIPESERDSTLKDRLREEYPAILASMIAACVVWQAQGLGKPQTVADATENYLRMNDVLGEFIEDCLDIGQEAFSLSGAAYKRFSTYCAGKGEKYVMSHRTFTQRLETRGYPAAKVGGQRIYRGFAIRSGENDPGASERPSWHKDD